MIAVGKSSATKLIANHLGTKPFFEPVGDNPILTLYYGDQKKYGFLLQIYFLNRRFQMIKEAYLDNNNVLDRSIYEDALFTYINYINGNMAKEEYDVYVNLLDNMMEEIDGLPKKAPELMVYFDADYETILNRINLRGREFEQIDGNPELENYYKKVWAEYKRWYEEYDKSPKIKINLADYDLSTLTGAKSVLYMVDAQLWELKLISDARFSELVVKIENLSMEELTEILNGKEG